MSPGRRRGVVLVLGARVQHVRVGQELDIPDVEDHVQGEALAGLFEDFEGVELSGGEWRDDARVGEAAEGADVVGVPSVQFMLVSVLVEGR